MGAKAMAEKALPDTNVRRIISADDKIADFMNLREHPLAALMPMIKAEPFERLKADIAANGLREKIKLFRGMILDGRNRYKALRALAEDEDSPIKLEAKFFEEFIGTEDQAQTYVVSTNVIRRQLSDADKKMVVKNLLARFPGLANREIARIGGFSHSFVGKVKEELEAPEKKKQAEAAQFGKWFDMADDKYRVEFVKTYLPDLRSIMKEIGAKV